MMHGYWFGSYGWIWMIVNAVFWLAVIGGVVWAVIWAVRQSGTGSGFNSAPAGISSKEIAQLRYARGEITREQYQQLVDDLMQ